jgi:hypothetical protein
MPLRHSRQIAPQPGHPRKPLLRLSTADIHRPLLSKQPILPFGLHLQGRCRRRRRATVKHSRHLALILIDIALAIIIIIPLVLILIIIHIHKRRMRTLVDKRLQILEDLRAKLS